MKKFWKNAPLRLKLGLIITIFFLILGFVVYFIPHADPFPNNIRFKNLPPSSEHFFGTTSQGQDIFWLLIEAIHNSLTIGFIVALIGTVVGVMVGLISGSDHDDLPHEGKFHGPSAGPRTGGICLGLAQPSDPLHGSDHERERLHPYRMVLR